MLDLQRELGEKGLVVMALSDESDEKVADYVEQYGLSDILVAAGSTNGKDFGIRGYPTTYLIDPEGNVAWVGHPSALSSSTVKKALKGARPMRDDAFLSVRVEDAPSALSSAAKAADAGDLAKALERANGVLANEHASEEDLAAAKALIGAVDARVALLRGQVDGMLERREMLRAMRVLELLAKSMDGTEAGTAVAQKRQSVLDDETLNRELEAAEALAKADEHAAKRGRKRAAKKYEDVAEDFKGTKAGERARMILRDL